MYADNQAQSGRLSKPLAEAQEPPMPEIPGALCKQRDALLALHDYISNLETKLQPVLSPSAPQECGKSNSESVPSTRFGEALREDRGIIDHAIERLRDLFNRCQL